jgi:NADH:ubiquinone oxidoreductase subunit K
MGPWLDVANPLLSLALLGIGLACMLMQRRVIKQVIGLSIMLQGALLNLVEAARLNDDMATGQSLVISALVAETIVVAIVLALIINVYRHYPSGLVDDLDRLKG